MLNQLIYFFRVKVGKDYFFLLDICKTSYIMEKKFFLNDLYNGKERVTKTDTLQLK